MEGISARKVLRGNMISYKIKCNGSTSNEIGRNISPSLRLEANLPEACKKNSTFSWSVRYMRSLMRLLRVLMHNPMLSPLPHWLIFVKSILKPIIPNVERNTHDDLLHEMCIHNRGCVHPIHCIHIVRKVVASQRQGLRARLPKGSG